MINTLRYGTSLVLRDPDGSTLVEWACDGDRVRHNLAHAVVRAKMWIGPDPYPSGKITLTHVLGRDYDGQDEYHWIDPHGSLWVLSGYDLSGALAVIDEHLGVNR